MCPLSEGNQCIELHRFPEQTARHKISEAHWENSEDVCTYCGLIHCVHAHAALFTSVQFMVCMCLCTILRAAILFCIAEWNSLCHTQNNHSSVGEQSAAGSVFHCLPCRHVGTTKGVIALLYRMDVWYCQRSSTLFFPASSGTSVFKTVLKHSGTCWMSCLCMLSLCAAPQVFSTY